MKKDSKELIAYKVTNISREIKPSTERMLWGVSAGVCEFGGCTNKLFSHHVTKENVNLQTLGFSVDSSKGYQALITPIDIAGERLGSLFIYKKL